MTGVTIGFAALVGAIIGTIVSVTIARALTPTRCYLHVETGKWSFAGATTDTGAPAEVVAVSKVEIRRLKRGEKAPAGAVVFRCEP